MLSHSDIQKIQSLANKPMLQLLGRYMFTTLTPVGAAFGMFAVCGTAVALKHNIDDGGLYRL